MSEQSERLQARKEALAEAISAHTVSLSERADTLQQNLQVQVLEAERSVEERLDQLEKERQAWVRARRRAWNTQTAELLQEMYELKASLRIAKKNAKSAIRQWKKLSGAYAQSIG